MLQVGGYLFKRAETSQEFEQIHSLNYRTFVGEIPQHPDPGTGRLVDKFHDKNAYFIAVRDDRVVGMVSVHNEPPFSVADRLSDPSLLQRPGTRPLEIRLLAIEPDKRHSAVFAGLIWSIYDHARRHGHTHLFISGVEDRLPLYQQLGFEPLGPALRHGKARFIPMGVTLGQLEKTNRRFKQLMEKRLYRLRIDKPEPRAEETGPLASFPSGIRHSALRTPHSAIPLVCLLPGPVTVAPAVEEAFHRPAIYHRGPHFISLFEKVRRTLGTMVGGRDVALFNGSGTLANEVVAATLAAEPEELRKTRSESRGVLLVNGEFGHRLARQAARFGLQPRILTWRWGQPWDLEEIDAVLADEPPGSWVWGVHQESSTGVLNDLAGLVRLARARSMRVCMDCISSLGAVPLDLRDVYLASGATGKALGSYAGKAIVFADAAQLARVDTSRVPSYLDLPAALATVGPRYTFPSPTLLALEAALSEYATPEATRSRYERYAALGAYVRQRLRDIGLEPLADESYACPVVTSFAPPGLESSEVFVTRCQAWGFTIGGQSGYLAERRLVQIATMGAVSREMCEPLFEHLAQHMGNGNRSLGFTASPARSAACV